MTLYAFQDALVDNAIARAQGFLADPYAASVAQGYERDQGVYYALGQAQGVIASLLDALGCYGHAVETTAPSSPAQTPPST